MSHDHNASTSPLDTALDALPRGIEPGRDLWPAIEARLEPREVHAGRRWLWPAAAAVLLVVGSTLITATLLRDDEPLVAQRAPAAGQAGYADAAFGPGQALDPAYETARQDLARTLSARIDRLPPDAACACLRRSTDLYRQAASWYERGGGHPETQRGVVRAGPAAQAGPA